MPSSSRGIVLSNPLQESQSIRHLKRVFDHLLPAVRAVWSRSDCKTRSDSTGQHLKPTHERIIRYKWTAKIYRKLPSITMTIIVIIKKFIEHFCGPRGVSDPSNC